MNSNNKKDNESILGKRKRDAENTVQKSKKRKTRGNHDEYFELHNDIIDILANRHDSNLEDKTMDSKEIFEEIQKTKKYEIYEFVTIRSILCNMKANGTLEAKKKSRPMKFYLANCENIVINSSNEDEYNPPEEDPDSEEEELSERIEGEVSEEDFIVSDDENIKDEDSDYSPPPTNYPENKESQISEEIYIPRYPFQFPNKISNTKIFLSTPSSSQDSFGTVEVVPLTPKSSRFPSIIATPDSVSSPKLSLSLSTPIVKKKSKSDLKDNYSNFDLYQKPSEKLMIVLPPPSSSGSLF